MWCQVQSIDHTSLLAKALPRDGSHHDVYQILEGSLLAATPFVRDDSMLCMVSGKQGKALCTMQEGMPSCPRMD